MSELDDVRNSLADTFHRSYMITVPRWSSYGKQLAVMAKDCGVTVEITNEGGGLLKKDVVFMVKGADDKQNKFKFMLQSAFEQCTLI